MVGTRAPKVKLKKPRKHTNSSQRWLLRQLNDPYVAEAKRQGYRSRAAFKLLEIDEQHHILKPGMRVLDLGCAPGGWLQVVIEKIKPEANNTARIVGVDLLAVDQLPHVSLIQGDFLDEKVLAQVLEALGGQADIVLSDMAASSTGHSATDHLKIIALLEAAHECAEQVLATGGVFVGKVLQGGTEKELLAALKRNFERVVHVKPKASRKESAELYVVAKGFRRKVS